jgi:hypothetical protein
MAFDLGEIKEQVKMMVSHEGIDAHIRDWTNWTIMDIATRAYWGRQMDQVFLTAPTYVTTYSQALGSNVLSTARLDSSDVINFFQVELGTANQSTQNTTLKVSVPIRRLERDELQDHYLRYVDRSTSPQTTDTDCKAFVVQKWAGNDTYHWPVLDVFPALNPNTAGTPIMARAKYLRAPQKLNLDADTNWVVRRYFKTVLAGVLRYARLYKGEAQQFLLEMAEYEDGIRDMLLNEETYKATTPTMRGITPEGVAGFGG